MYYGERYACLSNALVSLTCMVVNSDIQPVAKHGGPSVISVLDKVSCQATLAHCGRGTLWHPLSILPIARVA